jgi:hypothetical protein
MEKGIIGKIDNYYEYDVRAVWDKIKIGVEKILTEDNDWLTLRPEDVYSQCLHGTCRIWSPEEYPVSDVFGITKIDTCPYRLNKTLQMLIAWSVVNDTTIRDSYDSLMTTIANATGCDGIEFWTSSVKVADYSIEKGFTKRIHVCRRNIPKTINQKLRAVNPAWANE